MADPRPKCSYYETCYRKNPTHLAQFRHPADDKAAAAAGAGKAEGEHKPSLLKAAAHATIATAPKKATAKPATADGDVEMKQAEAKHGTKRAREDSAASPRPPSPAAAAASSSKAPSSPKPTAAVTLPDSAKDAVFELKDDDVSDETKKLWTDFHAGCWSTSCPVHSKSSSPESFFQLGSALLTALYGGLEFPADLYQTLEFFAVEQNKLAHPVSINIGSYKPGAAAAASDAASSSSAAAASSSSDAMSDAPAATCSWHASGNSLLHSFAPLLGIQLIGPFKILCGHLRHVPVDKVHPYLLDRFFYDSPEVWAVLQRAPEKGEDVKEVKFSEHWAYYRDDPSADQPAAFVGRLTENSPAVTLVGPNLLAALMAIIDDRTEDGGSSKKQKKLDAGQTTLSLDGSSSGAADLTLDTFRSDLDTFARHHGYTLLAKGGKRPPPKRDSAWVKREKKVVVDLDNKVGLVVPYAEDIGWRPVPSEPHELAKIVSDIEKAKYSGAKVNFDALDYLVTLCNYATDERDPGMAIELSLNLMAKSKTNAINSDICRLLALNYQQVERNLYADVINKHMRFRTRHIRQLPRDRFARVH